MKLRDEIKYFIYCRKSSEDDDRQSASIEAQRIELKKIAGNYGLCVIDILEESQSAKKPGRPIFNSMLERIHNGEAHGIICWKLDRLARNPIDGGLISWMLQNSSITQIRTYDRTYYPSDNVMMMQFEFGMANQYVRDLSVNVKRGLNNRALKGWKPTSVPLGYRNFGTEKGDKTIVIDQERFDIVRKMWDLILSGAYSAPQARKVAIEQWGLRTFQHKRIGGKAPSMSHIYKILKDPFYYGYFEWKDSDTGEKNLIKGNHQPMITEAEYRRVQVLLGKKGNIKPHTKEFAFTGLMHCGECDSMITAEEKNQIICSECKNKFAYERKTACPKCGTDISKMHNPKILNYVYYHCTKKKNPNCSQKTIRVENLETQFNKKLLELEIDEDYLRLALDYLQDKQKNSGGTEKKIRLSLQSSYDVCQTSINNLNREYTSPHNSNHELYTPEEFGKEKARLMADRKVLEGELAKVKEGLDESFETTERIFNFCTYAQRHFNTPDLKKKREIFSTIGSNLILKDRELKIERLHPYVLVENEWREQKKLLEGLEPEKDGYLERRKAAFAARRTALSAL